MWASRRRRATAPCIVPCGRLHGFVGRERNAMYPVVRSSRRVDVGFDVRCRREVTAFVHAMRPRCNHSEITENRKCRSAIITKSRVAKNASEARNKRLTAVWR